MLAAVPLHAGETSLLWQIDIHAEYASDMRAAGLTNFTVRRSWFAKLFKTSPELADITISALKRNFGRCSVRSQLPPAASTNPPGPPAIALAVAGSTKGLPWVAGLRGA